PQRGIVVDEADHSLAGRLAQLAQHASAAAACADEHDASRVATGDELAERVRDAALPEARDADQHRAEQRVDQECAAREAVPRNCRPDEEEGSGFGQEDGRDDRHRIARAGVAPYAPIQAEEYEEDVPRDEERRQREVEDMALKRITGALESND